jgi:hypothetical protein
MLCRYEAWFLGGVYVVCVVFIARKLGYRGRDLRGLALIPIAFGLLGAALGWMFYNWVIFGSPVNFLTGAGSSARQMAHRTDPEIGSITTTLRAYGTAVTANLGLALVAVAVTAVVLVVVLSGSTFVLDQVVIATEARNANTYLEPQAQTADLLAHQTSGRILMNGYGNEKVLFPVLERTI